MTWAPFPGGQTEFCSRGEFEALFGGQAGPGKTDCLVNLATRYTDNPRYRGLLLRRTYPQLEEIMDRCWLYYSQMGAVYRAQEKRWYFSSGSFIKLGHMQHEDDKYNYQGKDYHFIGPDELTQFSPAQYLYLFSRCRTTDTDIPPMIRSATNPGGIGHKFVKERFVTETTPGRTYIDPKTGLSRVFIKATPADNPALFEKDPHYIDRLEALPYIERQRLKHGIWDTFEGQVFAELSTQTHGIDMGPEDVPPEWEKFMIFDWGYARPFCALWFAVDYDGTLYCYREWYGALSEDEPEIGLKMPAFEVARGMWEHEQEKVPMRLADPSIWHPRPRARLGEARGRTIVEDFASEKVHFMKADNDRMQGKQQVHRRLKLVDEVDRETGEIMAARSQLYISKQCKYTWNELLNLHEDPKNPEDVDTNQPDHAYDCIRYGCMYKPIIPKKVEQIPTGSFAAERRKMIRAKRYAKQHGCSMQAAYQRVR